MASQLVHLLLPREDQNGGCTQATCPPSRSIYGYTPSLAATLVCLIIFSLSTLTYLIQGIKTRTWIFTVAMVCGGLSEIFGYIAKMLLWNNPFSDTGFLMSVSTLTFAPAFYAGGIYYTLKYICLTFDPSQSRLRPALYPWIFITADFFSIVLQAVGGALSSASTNLAALNQATNVMIAGLVTQVATLLIFGGLAADYGIRIYRNRATLNPATEDLRKTLKFKCFIVALWVAYFGILIRCTYRVAELSQGWTHNPILHMEGLFIGLDSVPILLCAVVLNIWHPGWCFPKSVQGRSAKKGEKAMESDVEAV